MRIERAERIGGVEEPVASFLVRHDVDNAADGIRSETDRDYSFIYFDAFGEIDRYIVQGERTAYAFLRHAVDKDLHVLSAETVEHQLHVRAYTARFAEFHARCFGERVAQAFGGVLQFLGIYGYGVESRTFQAADAVGNDYDFIQFFHLRSDGDMLFYALAVDKPDLLFYCFIADGGYD